MVNNPSIIPSKGKSYLLIVLFLSTIFTLWRIEQRDLAEWDESRNGVNAYEMYHNGDYINLYYGGAPDTWNAKPPLMIWLIVVCSKIFGFGALALRLPAAISTILFFYYFYRLTEKLGGSSIAFLSCLLLCSCRAVIGFHAGINGDFDALLLVFLTASAWHFIRFIEDDKKNDIYLVAVFTGLAFYSKGTAALLFTPGFLLYALVRKKASTLFANYRTWISVLIFLVIAGSWLVLVGLYGKETEQSHYGSTNSIETMLVYDTFERLANPTFDGKPPDASGIDFLLLALDVRLNIWNYLLYLGLLTGIVLLFRNRKHPYSFLTAEHTRAVLFCLCMSVPILTLLTVAGNPHDWYMIPAFGFLAFLIVKTVLFFSSKWRPSLYLAAALFAFTFVRHFVYLHTLPDTLHNFFLNGNKALAINKPVIVLSPPRQHVKLYLAWLNKDYIKLDDPTTVSQYSGHPILLDPYNEGANVTDKIASAQSVLGYTVAVIK